jgi:hypothetical protein
MTMAQYRRPLLQRMSVIGKRERNDPENTVAATMTSEESSYKPRKKKKKRDRNECRQKKKKQKT